MNELIELIERLRRTALDHEVLLRSNEFMVRYVLIDPLLRALGWDTEDPDLVRPEEIIGVAGSRGRPDYTLYVDGNAQMYIGAKALGQSENLDQHISYCVSQGVPFFAATDGVNWEVYDVFKQVPTDEKVIERFNILAMEPGEVVRRSLALWRSASIGESAPPPLLSPASTLNAPPSVNPGASPVGTNRIQLSALDVKPRQTHPSKLIDPDGVEHSCSAWKDVLVTVTRWLVDGQKIAAADCPVIMPKARLRCLLNTTADHPGGDAFDSPVGIEGLWLEAHASAVGLTRRAVYLLEQFGGGGEFRVEV